MDASVDEFTPGDVVSLGFREPIPGPNPAVHYTSLQGHVLARTPHGLVVSDLDSGVTLVVPSGNVAAAWSHERRALPETIVRTYRANSQPEAASALRREAHALGLAGYEPTTQSWAQGQWRGDQFLVALALCVIFVGLLIFLYMLVVKPPGTLSVIFARSNSPPRAQELTIDLALKDRLAELAAARGAGLITEEEYLLKRAQLIERF